MGIYLMYDGHPCPSRLSTDLDVRRTVYVIRRWPEQNQLSALLAFNVAGLSKQIR